MPTEDQMPVAQSEEIPKKFRNIDQPKPASSQVKPKQESTEPDPRPKQEYTELNSIPRQEFTKPKPEPKQVIVFDKFWD